MATSSSSSSTAPATTASSTTTTTATLDNNNNGEGGILQHADAISQAMGLLLKSPKYSDLTIACQGREFHVHRAIVCPHSRFFDMACSGDFKEAHDNKIVLEDDDPDTVERMISYMYTFDYQDEMAQLATAATESQEGEPLSNRNTSNTVPSSSSCHSSSSHGRSVGGCGGGREGGARGRTTSTSPDDDSHSPALFSSVRLYATADKYDIQPLKDLARRRFTSWTAAHWTHAQFPSLAREIYDTTPPTDRGLRDEVERAIALHADALISHADVRALLQDIDDLALGVLSSVIAGRAARIRDLEADVAAARSKLDDAQRRGKDASARLAKAYVVVDCRFCRKNYYVKADGDWAGDGGRFYRCDGCRRP